MAETAITRLFYRTYIRWYGSRGAGSDGDRMEVGPVGGIRPNPNLMRTRGAGRDANFRGGKRCELEGRDAMRTRGWKWFTVYVKGSGFLKRSLKALAVSKDDRAASQM